MDIYTNKKHPEVTAKIVKQPNESTVILEYLTGDEVGKTVTVTTGTLKRWWGKSTEKSANEILGVDADELNEPYPEPKEKKYIPKPQAVVEYEEKKKSRFNNDLPKYEDLEGLLDDIYFKKYDKDSHFMFKDKSTLWRKSSCIDLYVTEELWTKFTEAGFTSKPNKDKDRPFAIKVVTNDEWNLCLSVLNGMYRNEE
jgi:hypothetical protein